MATGSRGRWRGCRAGIGLILTATLVACGQPVVEVPPTPATVGAQPGIWGVSVVTPEAASERLPEASGRGEVAMRSGATGAGGSVAAGVGGAAVVTATMSGWTAFFLAPAFLLGGVVLAPVAAVAAAAGGAAAAGSAEERAEAEASLTAAVAEAQEQETADLAAALIEEAAISGGRQLLDCGDAFLPAECVAEPENGPDLLIRLVYGPPMFEAQGSINPKLRLLQPLDATLVAAGEAEPVYRRTWLFRGPAHRYYALAENDARLLRQDFARARAALVEKAAADLFRPGAVERHTGKEQPEGSVWTILPPGVPVDRGASAGR